MIYRKVISILVLTLSVGILGCNGLTVRGEKKGSLGVSENNKLLRYFTSNFKDKKVIKCAYGDLNNDHRKDLVVIYGVSKDKNKMRVILDLSEKYKCTNQVPAPVSNQKIRFKNIDDKPPMEFIVQGSKGVHIGYAIFRVYGTRLVDLFGEGMSDCC